MKPPTAAFLEKSRALLEQAKKALDVGLDEVAGRTAYLAGFHAAQALIFERDDRVLKTHKGVQGEFGRLVRDDSLFDIALRALLGRSYQLKTIADYETSPDAEVTHAQAAEAIATAQRFVDAIEKAIAQ